MTPELGDSRTCNGSGVRQEIRQEKQAWPDNVLAPKRVFHHVYGSRETTAEVNDVQPHSIRQMLRSPIAQQSFRQVPVNRDTTAEVSNMQPPSIR